MSGELWVKRGSQVLGPFSSRQLRQAAADGELKPDDRVSRDRVKWVLVSTVGGLKLDQKRDAGHAADSGDARGHKRLTERSREGTAEKAIAANDGATWYCNVMGTESGPIPSEELREMAFSGRLTPDSLVRRSPSDDWVSADRVAGLFDSPEAPGSKNPVAVPPLPSSDSAVPPSSTRPGSKGRFPLAAVLCAAGVLLVTLTVLVTWLVSLLIPAGPSYGHSFNLITGVKGDSYALEGYTEVIAGESRAFSCYAVLVVGVTEGAILGKSRFEYGSIVVIDQIEGEPAFRKANPGDRIVLRQEMELFGETYGKGRFRVPESGNLLAASSDGEGTAGDSSDVPAGPVQYLGRFHTIMGFIKDGAVEDTLIILEGEPPSPQQGPFYFGCYGSDLAGETGEIPFTSYRGMRGIPKGIEKVERGELEEALEVLILKSAELIVQ